MDFLRPDSEAAEPYVFIDGASAGIEAVLDVIFALMTDPRDSIDDLISFACALELELRSPAAASFLRACLAIDPRVVETIGGASAERARLDAQQAATAWGGKEEAKQAPFFGAEAPDGTIKAASLVEEQQHRRFQARREPPGFAQSNAPRCMPKAAAPAAPVRRIAYVE